VRDGGKCPFGKKNCFSRRVSTGLNTETYFFLGETAASLVLLTLQGSSLGYRQVPTRGELDEDNLPISQVFIECIKQKKVGSAVYSLLLGTLKHPFPHG
jgi:hypothetical protein